MNSKVMNKVLSFLLVAAVAFTTIFTPVNAATVNSRDKKLKGKIKEMHVYDGLTEIANKDTIQMAVGATKTLTIEFVDKSEKKAATHQVVAKSNNKKAVAATADYDKDLNESVVTLAVDATAKAGDKATVTIKSKAKKVKTVKFNVEVIEMVPVTGVTLDNTAPKVGDTINAKVDPANATGTLTYVWMADGVAIDTTATTSFTVTSAEIGKKISVKVTGDNGSEATSAETEPVEAPATEKVQILSAEQKSGTVIEVKFNKKVSLAEYSISVTRGTTAQTVDAAIPEDGLSATLTLGAKMGAADYVIAVASKTDETDKAEYTLTAEVAALASLEFQGDNLVLTNTEGTTAAVGLKGKDQFGGDIVLTSSNLQLYSSVGGKTNFDNDTQRVTLEVEQAILLNVGNKVTITAMYNSGTTYVQQAGELTVAQRAYVKDLKFGELSTTKTTLVGQRVTLDNFKSNTYYLPIETAIDQYDNTLTAKELNKMIEGNLLFMIPSDSMGSYYAYTEKQPFDTVDGKVILNLKKGDLNKPGEFQVTATSVGGGTFTTNVTLEDNPWIETLNITVPEVYAGTKVDIDVTAVDQYGDPFDLYENFPADPYPAFAAGGVYFGDLNNLTSATSTFVSTKGKLTYTKDLSKKAVKLTYDNATAGGTNNAVANGGDSVVFTKSTAFPNVNTQTIVINTTGYAAGIKGLASGTNTNMSSGASIDFTDLAVLQFLDSYGAIMKKGQTNAPIYAASKSKEDVATATGVSTAVSGSTATDYTYYKPDDYSDAFYTVATSGAAARLVGGKYTAAYATETSATITITLYPVKNTGTTAAAVYAWDTPVTKTISLTVSDPTKLSYQIAVKDNKTLHVGDPADLVTIPTATITLKAFDSSKTEVSLAKENLLQKVESANGLKATIAAEGNSATFTYTGTPEITGTGSTKVTAYVNGADDPVQCDLNYDDAVSVSKTPYFQKYTAASDAFSDVTGAVGAVTLYVNDKTKADGAYYVGVNDQYGDAIIASTLTYVESGYVVKAGSGSTTPHDYNKATYTGTEANQGVKLRCAYGDLGMVVTGTDSQAITLKGLWAQGGSSNTVKTLASLKTALANAAGDSSSNTITLDADATITLDDDTVIPVGDTLIVKDGTTLTIAAGKKYTVDGTIYVESGATLTNEVPSTLSASSTAEIYVISSTGTIDNAGSVIVLGATGSSNTYTTKVTNGGTINNASAFTCSVAVALQNDGVMTTTGAFTTSSGGALTITGTKSTWNIGEAVATDNGAILGSIAAGSLTTSATINVNENTTTGGAVTLADGVKVVVAKDKTLTVNSGALELNGTGAELSGAGNVSLAENLTVTKGIVNVTEPMVVADNKTVSVNPATATLTSAIFKVATTASSNGAKFTDGSKTDTVKYNVNSSQAAVAATPINDVSTYTAKNGTITLTIGEVSSTKTLMIALSGEPS